MKLDSSDLRLVRERIRASNRYIEDKLTRARRTERMRQWYEGRHYDPNASLSKILEADRIVVNYSLINVLVKVAQLAFGEPAFRVHAKRRGFDTSLDKLVLDYTWREIKATRATRAALFDSKVVGTGVCATNWRIETARMVYQGGDEPNVAEPIIYDNPEVRRVKPEWFLVDPDRPDDWQKGWYAGERWRCPLIQMRRSPRYEGIADKLTGLVKPDYAASPPASYRAGEGEAIDENLRQVEAYTLYLRDLGLVVDWCEELPDEPLWVGDADYYPTDPTNRPYYPYAMLGNIPLPDTHYGLSDIEVTETQQAEIDMARSQLAMIRRQNNGQMAVLKGVLDETAKDMIQQGIHNAVIEVDLVGQRLAEIMQMLPRGQAQPEIYTSLDKAQMDMSELSRASAFRRGAAVPGVKYATEAALIQQGTQGLAADERAEYERFVAEVGSQVMWLLHRWAKELREVESAGGGHGRWTEWSAEKLTRHAEFLVEPSSMDPPDSAMEEGKWAQRLQLLIPLVQMGLNPRPIVESYLRAIDFPAVEEVLANVGMPPVPLMPGLEGANVDNTGADQAGIGAPPPGEEEGALGRLLALAGQAGPQG